jgi:hypothetical protein
MQDELKPCTPAPPTAPMASGNVSPIATDADLREYRRAEVTKGNGATGGSDSRAIYDRLSKEK